MMRVGLLALLCTVIGGLSGCKSSQSMTEDDSERYHESGLETSESAETMPAEPVLMGGNVVELAFPTGDRRTSAILLRQAMPATVTRGEAFEYSYEVLNLTDATLQNVAVMLESRDNLEIVSSSPSAQRGAEGMMWFIGDLAPRTSELISVSARADQIGNAANCVSVTYNNSLCAFVRVVEPQLTLTKTATPSVLLCEPVLLTYEVCNPGSGVARGVVVRDELPAGLTLAGGGGTVVERQIGDLAAGECREFQVTAEATRTGSFSSAGVAEGGASLRADSSAPTTLVSAPELTISSICRDNQFINRNTEYVFSVTNTGDGPARDAMVMLDYPTSARFVGVSSGGSTQPGRASFALGTLPAGESRDVSVTLSSGALGDLRVVGRAQAFCADAVEDDCVTEYRGIPAILLEVVDLTDPVEIGTETTYQITVTNQGSAPDRNIRVVCVLPEEQQFLNAGGATNASTEGQTVRFAPLASLAPKAQAVWTVRIRAAGQGDVRFAVEMTSDQFQRPIRETESTNLYE